MASRILIVDDDAEDGELTRRRLESLDATVDFHHGATGAIAAINTGGYDVVLLDLNMPGISGLQILGMLKHQHKTSVLLFSSMEEAALREVAVSAGVSYLSKNVPKAELLERMQTLLAAHV